MFYHRKGNKYKNIKISRDGVLYDSRAEANRAHELQLLEEAGEITNLRRQVPFELIPTQREPDTIGKRGVIIKGKVIEKGVNYIADFVYNTPDGVMVVEDVKSPATRTPEYIIKRKLMLHIYNIKIHEIGRK